MMMMVVMKMTAVVLYVVRDARLCLTDSLQVAKWCMCVWREGTGSVTTGPGSVSERLSVQVQASSEKFLSGMIGKPKCKHIHTEKE